MGAGGDCDAPSVSKAAMLRILAYASLMLRSFIICVSAGIRIQCAKPSAYENNKVFRTIAIVASSAVAFVFVLLFAGYSRPMRDGSYAFLKFIGCFSAFLGPFSLLMVALLPPELNWIGYLLVCLMFGILVTCFYLDDRQPDKSSAFHNFVICYVLLFISPNIIVPSPHQNWIMYPVIYVCLWIEIAYHFIASLMFIHQKTRKPEALPLIQQHNSHPPPYFSYLMQLGSD